MAAWGPAHLKSRPNHSSYVELAPRRTSGANTPAPSRAQGVGCFPPPVITRDQTTAIWEHGFFSRTSQNPGVASPFAQQRRHYSIQPPACLSLAYLLSAAFPPASSVGSPQQRPHPHLLGWFRWLSEQDHLLIMPPASVTTSHPLRRLLASSPATATTPSATAPSWTALPLFHPGISLGWRR